MEPFKFGTLEEGVPFVYPNLWEQEETTGPDRLVIAPASGQVELIRKLIAVLPEPFYILFCLFLVRRTKKGVIKARNRRRGLRLKPF